MSSTARCTFRARSCLSVSAQYAAPLHMDEQLTKKNYRDVYLDLFSASVAGIEDLREDLGANGLVAEAGGQSGLRYLRRAGKPLAFDGDWATAEDVRSGIPKAFAAADEHYSQILTALLAQAKK